jgi:hypothetical protein
VALGITTAIYEFRYAAYTVDLTSKWAYSLLPSFRGDISCNNTSRKSTARMYSPFSTRLNEVRSAFLLHETSRGGVWFLKVTWKVNMSHRRESGSSN